MKQTSKYEKKPLILIVDDYPENLQVLGKILDIAGYDIAFADDSLLVYELVKKNKPDMILMDVMMPHLDGYQLADLIKSDEELADIPIIFVTANQDKNGVFEAFNSGGVDYIVKPYDHKELLIRVDTHLQLKFAKKTIQENLEELQKANSQLQKAGEEKDKYLNILHQELRSAADYIVSLLPPIISKGKILADWLYVPTSELGGDSFGYKYLDRDHFAFYLLDVCGHGICSAFHSLSILNSINYQNMPDTNYYEPEQVLQQLNKRYRMNEHNDQFFSIFYGVFDTASGKLKYSGAGHPPAIIISNNKSHFLKSQNKIIGFLDDLTFVSNEIQLNEKSELYLYTDGAYEYVQPNGARGDIEDLVELIMNSRQKENNELQEIYDDALTRNGNKAFKDDFSLIKFSIKQSIIDNEN